MSEPVDPQTFRTLVEMTITNMYEVEALGELLEQKGLITKHEILNLATKLKRKNPSPPASTPDPSQQRFTDTDNAVIEELMAVILQHRLSADHAKTLLGRAIQLLEWGSRPHTIYLRRTPRHFTQLTPFLCSPIVWGSLQTLHLLTLDSLLELTAIVGASAVWLFSAMRIA